VLGCNLAGLVGKLPRWVREDRRESNASGEIGQIGRGGIHDIDFTVISVVSSERGLFEQIANLH